MATHIRNNAGDHGLNIVCTVRVYSLLMLYLDYGTPGELMQFTINMDNN